MIDTIASFEGRIAKVAGPARCGKTEALIRRCATLLARGVDPDDILVEVSSAFAADAFRLRLIAHVGEELREAARTVTVKSPLFICAEELASPAAMQATGRVPRLLNDAEYKFLLEDMKTLGVPIRRLRGMLAHFYRQWEMLTPHDAGVPGGEELVVLSLLTGILTSRKAMLRSEAPALCAEYLRSDAGANARHRFDYVLCDDFQNMSHAEQTSLCLMAKKQIIVCGNPNETAAIHTDHPYAEGFSRFDTVRNGVEVFTIDSNHGVPGIMAFAEALCEYGDMDAAYKASGTSDGSRDRSEDITCIKWHTSDEELAGIASYLRTLFDTNGALRENRVCVLVPNRHWAHAMKHTLSKRGFAVSCAGAIKGIGGDPRVNGRAQALVAYTKLNLLADPYDMTAWRSWCGFGNFLTNSDAWSALAEYAAVHDLSLYDALAETERLEDEPFLRADILAARWREGLAFIGQNAQRRGFALLHAIGAEGLIEFESVEHAIAGDEDAATLFAREQAEMMDPAFPADPHMIHLATYDSLCGTAYDTIIAIGAVDGFVPHRSAFEAISTEEDRVRVMNTDRKLFYAAVAKTDRALLLSYFSEAPLETAERTKMQVIRVKAENGSRVARVRPSAFLAEAGGACPGCIGGQTLLSTCGIA